MRIAPITVKNYNQSFKSTKRTTYYSDDKGVYILPTYNVDRTRTCSSNGTKIITSNSSCFFRKDLDWLNIGTAINSQFSTDKVDTHVFACSDGSEAYSLAIALIEQLGFETAKKYFPIYASDIDSEIIKQAKSGKIYATNGDIKEFIKIVKDKQLGKYFKCQKLKENSYELTANNVLRDNIIFSQEDIYDGLDNVKKSSSLILCRNFWKYLPAKKVAELTWKMRTCLDETSRILIGGYDKANGYPPFFLEGLGFYPVSHDYDFMNGNMLRLYPFEFDTFSSGKQKWIEHVEKNHPEYKLDYIYEKRSD